MRLAVAIGVLMTGLLCQPAQAAQPRTISYQGSLMDGSGLVSPDGSYTMSFRLWDAASGGLLLWQETDTVSVAAGLFNVTLGKNSPFTQTFTNPYWLGITVGTNPELTPRVKLSASPYAMHAVAADSLTGGQPGDRSCSVFVQNPGPFANNTAPVISFTSEEWDQGNFHDSAINPSRLVAPVSGTYLVTGYIEWGANGTGSRGLHIRKNGTQAPSSPVWQAAALQAAVAGSTHQNVSSLVKLAAGDYVELVVYQTSGGNLTPLGARFEMGYIGK